MNQHPEHPNEASAWRSTRRAPLAPSPLFPIIGRMVAEQAELTETDMLRLRRHCLSKVPRLGCEHLDGFYVDLIADNDVLWALFRPTPKNVVAMGRSEVRHELPFNQALKAGSRAYASQLLQPHERPAAWVAGFAWSIGAYAAACPCLASTRSPASMRVLLLEGPLANLKRRNVSLASTLAAALGCGDADDCDVAQVARIAASARTANLAATIN